MLQKIMENAFIQATKEETTAANETKTNKISRRMVFNNTDFLRF
jgi:hypothetical protein